MSKKKLNEIVIGNAEIMFRNFSGRVSKGNPAGSKNFAVVIPDEILDGVVNDGWNVKYLAPYNDGEPEKPILNVAVRYGVVDPEIYIITKTKKTLLTEENVSVLDSSEIANVDLIITPYQWQTASGSGVKAYCKKMYITIIEDEFADKYADLDF